MEKAKVKKAIQKGNMEGARIHAENAIRQKNQALNYLRMSARVDAVASRVQTALTTRKVTQSMAGVVKAMDAAMKSMNLEKISGLMDKFESQFEDLDVQSSYMENAMSQTTTTNVPQNDVDTLMQQVADEAGWDLLIDEITALFRVFYLGKKISTYIGNNAVIIFEKNLLYILFFLSVLNWTWNCHPARWAASALRPPLARSRTNWLSD